MPTLNLFSPPQITCHKSNPQALYKSLRLAVSSTAQPQLATTPSFASSQASLNCLKCLSTNATSLNNIKLLELSMIATDQNIDLIFITDTLFSEQSTTNLPHYNVHRKDRSDRHGGVLIYTKDQLNNISAQSFASHNSEQMWLNVSNLVQDNKTILIGCIYRPPTSDAHAFLLIANYLKSKMFTGPKENNWHLTNCWFQSSKHKLDWDLCQWQLEHQLFGTLLRRYPITPPHTACRLPTFNKADGSELNTLDLIKQHHNNAYQT